MAQDEPSRIDRIKLHFKEHKREYLIGTGCFVAGVATVVLLRRSEIVTKNVSLLSYKPVQVNEVTTILTRRGHPGNIILCNETGEVFASMRRACTTLGINRFDMHRYFEGKIPSVGKYTFEKLGEAVA
jgi:hypothetical protein